MDKTDYNERLKIPVEKGDTETKFLTNSGKTVAIGYERIVIGARGPYIEFTESQIVRENIFVPPNEMGRIVSDVSFYVEYRTADASNVKIYFQKKTVNYADYKIGFYYISPFDLKTDSGGEIIVPLNRTTVFNDIFF